MRPRYPFAEPRTASETITGFPCCPQWYRRCVSRSPAPVLWLDGPTSCCLDSNREKDVRGLKLLILRSLIILSKSAVYYYCYWLHEISTHFTSAKERSYVYVSRSVCLSVCRLDYSNSYERILTKFYRRVGRGPRRNWLDFSSYPEFFVRILNYYSRFFNIRKSGMKWSDNLQCILAIWWADFDKRLAYIGWRECQRTRQSHFGGDPVQDTDPGFLSPDPALHVQQLYWVRSVRQVAASFSAEVCAVQAPIFYFKLYLLTFYFKLLFMSHTQQ